MEYGGSYDGKDGPFDSSCSVSQDALGEYFFISGRTNRLLSSTQIAVKY
jgi:hypothetical protein